MPHHENKAIAEFIALQSIPKICSPSTKAMKTSASIVNPVAAKAPPELTLEYIIEKKPKPKKVKAFLQNLIDDIVAEQEE